jgi:hypothetical protein
VASVADASDGREYEELSMEVEFTSSLGSCPVLMFNSERFLRKMLRMSLNVVNVCTCDSWLIVIDYH